jgi:hypothetical protein
MDRTIGEIHQIMSTAAPITTADAMPYAVP